MPPLSPQNETTTPSTDKPEVDDAAKTLNHDSSPPPQTETTSLKPETDDAEMKPPPENETTSQKPETDDAEKKPQPGNETTSQKTETNDAEKKPPPENETTSQKPETNDAEKNPPPENETTATMNEPDKTTTAPTNKPEADDGEKKPPSEIETTSTMIEPDKTTTTPTNRPEIDEDKTFGKNGAAADPEISLADGKNGDPQAEEEAGPRPAKKASSRLKKLLKYFKLLQPKSPVAEQGSEGENAGQTEKDRLLTLIKEDFNYIKDGADKLFKFHSGLEKIRERADKEFQDLNKEENVEYLRELRKGAVKLKLQVPSKFTDEESLKLLVSKAKDGKDAEGLDKKMPWLAKKDVFKDSLEFKDFEARYKELPRDVKLCLLCFSVFPENGLIKKRLMVQWWVVEGYASKNKIAGDYFNLLIRKGFIEPVNENGSHVTGFCRMHPFYRSALVVLSERARFFNFDARGNPTQDFSKSFQSCLVGQGVISLPDHNNYDLDTIHRMINHLEKIHLLINVDESAVEFRNEWFSKMKNVNFLHLGRWSALPTDNREVQDPKFLNGFKSMSCLKFLSLQGISYVFGLPKSISYLTNLEILDLRACYNLESITDKIGLLRSLTHLDMSECYLLDRMPKSLSSLERLKVIKGFVVGDEKTEKKSCTLADLEKLPNLFKLCVYTGLREFPNVEHVRALGKMKSLRKLTITWGGNALQDDEASNSSGEGKKTENNNIPELKLEKLDLKCFPMSKTPDWLVIDILKELKKLYIRGGKFSDLGQFQDIDNWTGTDKKTWKVEVLRLKYLAEVEMEWKQLRELFPELVYLEQVRCPKLTLCPCDADGVWKNKTRPN